MMKAIINYDGWEKVIDVPDDAVHRGYINVEVSPPPGMSHVPGSGRPLRAMAGEMIVVTFLYHGRVESREYKGVPVFEVE